jgi:hypothetical protein
MGRIAGLDAVEKRKISCLYRKSNPDSSEFQSVARRYTDQTILRRVKLGPRILNYLHTFYILFVPILGRYLRLCYVRSFA